jgi:hypothetical protein
MFQREELRRSREQRIADFGPEAIADGAKGEVKIRKEEGRIEKKGR